MSNDAIRGSLVSSGTGGRTPLVAFAPPAWTEDALCAQIGPDLFFPPKGGSARDARAICAACPVTEDCLAYAIDYEAGVHGTHTSYGQIGIYGGLSPTQRRPLVRARRLELGLPYVGAAGDSSEPDDPDLDDLEKED